MHVHGQAMAANQVQYQANTAVVRGMEARIVREKLETAAAGWQADDVSDRGQRRERKTVPPRRKTGYSDEPEEEFVRFFAAC